MKRTDITFTEKMKEAVEQLQKGAFLNVKANDEINTMTIAWGMIGFIWKKPIFQTLVRESRHTFELIENSDSFTVSIPLNKGLKEQLAFCGTKSGRDVDKFKECGLTAVDGKEVDAPIVGECSLHYECKIIAKQRLNPEDIHEEDREVCYSNGDYHTMYYGEIVACYMTEE